MEIDKNFILSVAVAAFGTLASVAASAVAAYFAAALRAEVESLRREISDHRLTDREELKTWINGSFMRSKEAAAKFDSIMSRLGGEH